MSWKSNMSRLAMIVMVIGVFDEGQMVWAAEDDRGDKPEDDLPTVELSPPAAPKAEKDKLLLEKVAVIQMANGNCDNLAKKGDYLYMVMNESVTPLLVYDISDPARPKIVKQSGAPGWPNHCRLVGTNWLWTAHSKKGEGFFDISDPADPKPAAAGKGPNISKLSRKKFSTGFLTYISACDNDILYYSWHTTPAATKENPKPALIRQADIYDIRNADDPVLLSTIKGVIVRRLEGQILFTSGEGIQIYDVADPRFPKKLCVLDNNTNWNFRLSGSESYAYADGRLYLGIKRDSDFYGYAVEGGQKGVAVFDARDWRNVRLLGYGFAPDPWAGNGNLVYHKGYVIACDGGFGLRIFDVRDPNQIQEVSRYREGGELSAAVMIPERRLLALGQNIEGNVMLVDIKDPRQPRELGVFNHRLRTWGRMGCYQGNYLYFQGDVSKPRYVSVLFTLDIKDPNRLICTHAVTNVGRAYGMLTVGKHLYVGNGEIYSLENPAQPVRLPSRLPCGGTHTDLAYRPPYLYAANSFPETKGSKDGVLTILDLADPTKPAIVGQTALQGTGHRVVTTAFIGDYFFVSMGGSGVRAVDVRDPKNPKVARSWSRGACGVGGPYCHLWSDGKILFVGGYHNPPIVAFDVTGLPEKPVRLGKLDWAPSAWLMTGEPGYIYRVCLGRLHVVAYRANDQP